MNSVQRSRIALVAVVVCAMTLAGCSGAAVHAERTRPATSTASSGGVTLTVRVDRTSVPRGGSIAAQVVIDNHAKVAVPLPCMINGYFDLMLENDAIPARFTHTAVGCMAVENLKPGRTVLPSKIMATYSECIGPGGQSSDPKMLKCGAHETFPTLPSGTYRTALDLDGVTTLIPRPKPISIKVTDGPDYAPFPTAAPTR